jgi:cyclophilin family peptidyl-prolyl cis-trans isomerase
MIVRRPVNLVATEGQATKMGFMVVLLLLLLAGFQTAPPKPATPPAPAQPLEPAPGNPVAVISTSKGDITVELFKDKAPVSVENFLQYAREGFYESTVFHRIERGFVIQGGGYTEALVEKPTHDPILNEATNGLRNLRGTLGMARRTQLRSATSQFYVNLSDNGSLDHRGYAPSDFGYAVFGRVLSGMEVADRIGDAATRAEKPLEDVTIKSVTIK